MRSHTRRGFFQTMLENSNSGFQSDPMITGMFQKQKNIWREKILDPPVFLALKNSGKIGSEKCSSSKFDSTKSLKIESKPLSTQEHLPGNSYISYHHSSKKRFGSIINILRLSHNSQPLLIVKSLIPLDISDEKKVHFTKCQSFSMHRFYMISMENTMSFIVKMFWASLLW